MSRLLSRILAGTLVVLLWGAVIDRDALAVAGQEKDATETKARAEDTPAKSTATSNGEADDADDSATSEKAETEDEPTSPDQGPGQGGAEVVRLDRFRKK